MEAVLERDKVTKSKPIVQPYPTIYDIIKKLKWIVEDTRVNNPNLAYFAVLYLYVTIKVAKKIAHKGVFKDDDRMEKLDVIFAMRYIDAYKNWKEGKVITKSWETAFEFGKEENSMIMQHLLLGMNAHINLDLGIATVEATSSSVLENNDCLDHAAFIDIIDDFTTINKELKELTNTVEECLAKNSYFFGLIKKYGKNKEELLANFSVEYARTGAWYFASYYRKYKDVKTIKERDQDINKLAVQIKEPESKLIQLALTFGAITEIRTAKNFIPTMIKALDEKVGTEYDSIQKESLV